MPYESRKLVNDDGPNNGSSTENPRWRLIREWSVAEFVDRVAKRLGAPNDKQLRRSIYEMVLSDGMKSFRHGPLTYSGAMVLDLWAHREEDEPFEPFPNKREWDDFRESMRRLRDPNIPMLARAALLRIGERIEARQLSHAKANGWV